MTILVHTIRINFKATLFLLLFSIIPLQNGTLFDSTITRGNT